MIYPSNTTMLFLTTANASVHIILLRDLKEAP